MCVGNICRSPVGERLLQAALPEMTISSAGIGALVGHAADETMSAVASAKGLSLEGHVAKQFTPALGSQFDLILVMEPGHKRDILRTAPQLSGRTMLFDQWTGRQGIADPYRRERRVHEIVFEEIATAADAWAGRLIKG
ncbi:low molecular weight protein-tyrosine-phosphatase [Celeribacter indicus]|uniref:low molecular weight protein-tyrosine-phosphatase n=1 Tax=Celeribacter indicus TaxID=1208324 RepID=UPI00267492D3|nr:low molecular weight protein-tyrosine-phosphatase [Celeribacter indicus]